MPVYLFECDECGKRRRCYKQINERDSPEFCHHNYGGTLKTKVMTRLIGGFRIIAHREVDNPDNQLYRILTNNGTEYDQLALMRQDAKRIEERERKDAETFSGQREVTVDEIVGDMGLAEAAQSGEVGIQNWRAANIPPDPLEVASA